MDQLKLEEAHSDLLNWCRRRDFAGHDPFDGLNSRLFQKTPLKSFSSSRLLWTQIVKRSPVNLRSLALVNPERNAKGVALFSLAGLANYRQLQTQDAAEEVQALIDALIRMRISGYSGAAWGYNFDWQSRKFFAARGTPTIVPTAFAARALIESFESFRNEEHLRVARSACDFILNDLHRSVDSNDELCFSYSPVDRTKIFNASLFAAETLAAVGAHTGERELCEFAGRAARYVIRRQNDDGSWPYGVEANQNWIDSFHTAYVLSSLSRILKSCAEVAPEISASLERGYSFWTKSFFLADGWPKYYHDELYPADAHAAATAIVTLTDLRSLDSAALSLAGRIADWMIANLRDPSGFFYYQRRRFYTVRIPFMRWSEAWTLYAFARLLEEGKS
jgi:hypothetical protein